MKGNKEEGRENIDIQAANKLNFHSPKYWHDSLKDQKHFEAKE